MANAHVRRKSLVGLEGLLQRTVSFSNGIENSHMARNVNDRVAEIKQMMKYLNKHGVRGRGLENCQAQRVSAFSGSAFDFPRFWKRLDGSGAATVHEQSIALSTTFALRNASRSKNPLCCTHETAVEHVCECCLLLTYSHFSIPGLLGLILHCEYIKISRG